MSSYHKDSFVALGMSFANIANVLGEGDSLEGFTQSDLADIQYNLKERHKKLFLVVHGEETPVANVLRAEDSPDDNAPKCIIL